MTGLFAPKPPGGQKREGEREKDVVDHSVMVYSIVVSLPAVLV